MRPAVPRNFAAAQSPPNTLLPVLSHSIWCLGEIQNAAMGTALLFQVPFVRLTHFRLTIWCREVQVHCQLKRREMLEEVGNEGPCQLNPDVLAKVLTNCEIR